MSDTLSMREACQMLTRLPEHLAGPGEPRAITITRRGEPVLAILPYDLYESIVETLEVMGDEELMAALRQSVEDLEAGRTVPLDDLETSLSM